MKPMIRKIIAVCALVLCPVFSYGYTGSDGRMASLRSGLDSLAVRDSAYNRPIDVSVTNFSIAELVKGIAVSSGISIDICFDRRKSITCNIRGIPVKDMLYFICVEKDIDAHIVGDIVTLVDYIPVPSLPSVRMSLGPDSTGIAFDFAGCRLDTVARRFCAVTGGNLLFPMSLGERQISAFGQSMSPDEAVKTIAAVNGLTAKRENSRTWSILEGRNDGTASGIFHDDLVSVDSSGLVSAHLHNANLRDVIPDVLGKLGRSYFFAGRVDHRINIDVDSLALEPFLNVLLTGTPVTWRISEGVYVIGDMNGQSSLSSVSVYPMKYRTVEHVAEIIPAELKHDMEIKAFPDLNSLVISGDRRTADRIVSFLGEIDRSVPLIAIDVIIVDATDNSTQKLGLGIGTGKGDVKTGGSLSPGLDFTLDAESLNRLLGSFKGFGSINLGPVSQLFYADLQFLEEAGKIVLRSTPRLSTLNGHKAVLRSGEVKYYKESQVNIIGTQNPLQSESYLWKNVEASFVLDMTTYVSMDNTITLNISLSQDEFTSTDEDDKYAPPGIAKRSFTSIVKVRDGEMVLLGGIEKNLKDNSSRGLPYVSRVPVLRSVFGKTRKIRTDSKLNIFIRPTIIM